MRRAIWPNSNVRSSRALPGATGKEPASIVLDNLATVLNPRTRMPAEGRQRGWRFSLVLRQLAIKPPPTTLPPRRAAVELKRANPKTARDARAKGPGLRSSMFAFLTHAFDASAKIGLLPLLALTGALAQHVPVPDNIIVNSCPPAAMALERFMANQERDTRTSVESIEIEGSLPKLNKNGRLRAIRRILSGHHPEYQVLELSGDSTVTHELIVRYLHADERTAELSNASTAITPANYKFRYVGAVHLDDDLVYVFRIIPHKKAQGLINGVLWIDGNTGIPIRLSGYLVNNPSVFLKRVNVTRENVLRDGIVEARITHLLLETRLVGSARLVVIERPTADPGAESPVP
jgi:hypothetical protein